MAKNKKRAASGWRKLKINAFAITLFVIIILSLYIYFLNGPYIKMNGNSTTENLELKSKTDRNENALIDDDAIMGNADAPIAIIEFGDFMCKFCGELHREIEPIWRKEYIETGKAKYVFRDFVSSDHPQAYPAAEASECANLQGKKWQMYDLLFDNAYTGDSWAGIKDREALLNIFKKYGEKIGLNMEQFSPCLSNNFFANEINNDIFAGVSTGVSGTPTIFIGNDQTGFAKILGSQPYSVYKQIIDEKLNWNLSKSKK
ncbi:MAG: DsbA family protein [Nanoarchaeota archaeon]